MTEPRIEIVTPCPDCDGKGEGLFNPTGRATFNYVRQCPYCHGEGVSRLVYTREEAEPIFAEAIEAEAKKWPIGDHPLGWAQRVPPPGATMLELARAGFDALLGVGE